MKRRESGILLHITSLPSEFGIGDLGPSAYRFADFLAESGQHLWQILPLTPTETAYGNSPYHSISSSACNPLLISPELLLEEGLLVQEDFNPHSPFPVQSIDYPAVTSFKQDLLDRAYERFQSVSLPEDFERFCLENRDWLKDFALFKALKSHFDGAPWCEWPPEFMNRESEAVKEAESRFRDDMQKTMFFQYLFQRQWHALKRYCHERSIRLIGDMPIYMVYDSVDLWIRPEIYNLNEAGKPLTVAGVPPDYFSETGQLWGNPVYRWDVLREEKYAWWIQRMKHNLALYDHIRVDHFRGFVGYWEVPAHEETALNGRWMKAPAEDFFSRLLEEIPNAPIIAEDLGLITEDVHEVMNKFAFPGMKVLLFAFGSDLPTNPYAPHNHQKNSVVYTGTHDNNTVVGWFEGEATEEEKERLSRYIGRPVSPVTVHREMIRLAMMSVADMAVIPMQDILGQGASCRMNRPSTKKGNWEWRLFPDQLDLNMARDLREMTALYGRV